MELNLLLAVMSPMRRIQLKCHACCTSTLALWLALVTVTASSANAEQPQMIRSTAAVSTGWGELEALVTRCESKSGTRAIEYVEFGGAMEGHSLVRIVAEGGQVSWSGRTGSEVILGPDVSAFGAYSPFFPGFQLFNESSELAVYDDSAAAVSAAFVTPSGNVFAYADRGTIRCVSADGRLLLEHRFGDSCDIFSLNVCETGQCLVAAYQVRGWTLSIPAIIDSALPRDTLAGFSRFDPASASGRTDSAQRRSFAEMKSARGHYEDSRRFTIAVVNYGQEHRVEWPRHWSEPSLVFAESECAGFAAFSRGIAVKYDSGLGLSWIDSSWMDDYTNEHCLGATVVEGMTVLATSLPDSMIAVYVWDEQGRRSKTQRIRTVISQGRHTLLYPQDSTLRIRTCDALFSVPIPLPSR